MAQAIVTSQLMNLHFGRLKDQGRLSPVQARLHGLHALLHPSYPARYHVNWAILTLHHAAIGSEGDSLACGHCWFVTAAVPLRICADSSLQQPCAAGTSLFPMLGLR